MLIYFSLTDGDRDVNPLIRYLEVSGHLIDEVRVVEVDVDGEPNVLASTSPDKYVESARPVLKLEEVEEKSGDGLRTFNIGTLRKMSGFEKYNTFSYGGEWRPHSDRKTFVVNADESSGEPGHVEIVVGMKYYTAWMI